MEVIRRRVWANWGTATGLTSSPGPQDGCSSCFQRQGLNSRANLDSGDGFENGAPDLKWRERGGYCVCTSPLMQTICCHTDSAIQHLAEKEPVSRAAVCSSRQPGWRTDYSLSLLLSTWSDTLFNTCETSNSFSSTLESQQLSSLDAKSNRSAPLSSQLMSLLSIFLFLIALPLMQPYDVINKNMHIMQPFVLWYFSGKPNLQVQCNSKDGRVPTGCSPTCFKKTLFVFMWTKQQVWRCFKAFKPTAETHGDMVTELT